MTENEIESAIDEMFAGESGPPHGEWEPKYDVWGRIGLLEKLLNNWDESSMTGRKMIAQAAGDLIGEYWTNFEPIVRMLVRYVHLHEIVHAVLPHLDKGLFCDELLQVLVATGTREPEWTETIRENLQLKKFTEDWYVTDLPGMYSRITGLLDKLDGSVA